MEPITMIALAAGAYLLLKGKKEKPKKITEKPVGPRPTMLRLSVTVRDGELVFASNKDSRITIDDNEVVLREQVPFDVLVSVPESMAPPQVQELNGAIVAAGTVGETRDLLFRVTEYGQNTEEGANIRLSVMRSTTGGAAIGVLWLTALQPGRVIPKPPTKPAEPKPPAQAGARTKVYLGDDDLWFFGGYIDDKLILVDGPFANEQAATTAAANWKAAQG